MSLPGFTAERALGASGRSYRSVAGGAGARGGTAQPAAFVRPRQPQTREGINCTDCDGNTYTCALNERCARICTTDGQGGAWCEPR